MNGKKKCKECRAFWPLSNFHVDRKMRDGRANTCKACARESALKNYYDRGEFRYERPEVMHWRNIPWESKADRVIGRLYLHRGLNQAKIAIMFGKSQSWVGGVLRKYSIRHVDRHKRQITTKSKLYGMDDNQKLVRDMSMLWDRKIRDDMQNRRVQPGDTNGA